MKLFSDLQSHCGLPAQTQLLLQSYTVVKEVAWLGSSLERNFKGQDWRVTFSLNYRHSAFHISIQNVVSNVVSLVKEQVIFIFL